MLAHPAVRLALSPVLLAQAVQVRRRALVLPEAAGPRSGVAGQGPVLRLMIAGDSSAAGVGVAHQDQALAGQLVAALARDFTVEWRLIARTGATTAQTLATLRAQPLDPVDVAVTALGVNDVLRQVPLRRWAADQTALAELLTGAGARVVLRSGLPPMQRFPLLPRPLRDVLGAQAAAMDAVLAAAGTAHLRHLPFDPARLDPAMMAEDGFHPGAPIYAAWGAEAAATLRQALHAGGFPAT